MGSNHICPQNHISESVLHEDTSETRAFWLFKIYWGTIALKGNVIFAKAALLLSIDIRFQFVDSLDCKAQTEDSKGQAGPDYVGKEVHLSVEL